MRTTNNFDEKAIAQLKCAYIQEGKECKYIQEVLNYRFYLKMLFLRRAFKKGDCKSTSIYFSSLFRLSTTLWCLELAKLCKRTMGCDKLTDWLSPGLTCAYI